MTTPGFGSALRKQQRAADSQRRGRREGRSDEVLPEIDMGTDTCSVCGVEHPAAQGMQSEHGPMCAACYAHSEADAIVAPSRTWDIGPLALSALPLALMSTTFLDANPPTARGGMGWSLLAMLSGAFALLAVLHGARLVRDAWRPDEGHDRVALGIGGTSAVGGLLTGAASIGLFALPYLGVL